MRNVPDASCTENQNAYFMFNNFFPKILPFMRQRGKKKNGTAGEAKDDNTAHVICIPDN